MLLSANSTWTSRLSSEWQHQQSPFLQQQQLYPSFNSLAGGWEGMTAWSRESYTPRESQRSVSHLPKYSTNSSIGSPKNNGNIPSSSWESSHPPLNHSSSSSITSNLPPSSVSVGNQSFTGDHYRSASGPASTPINRSYGTPATPYSKATHGQAPSPSQHYLQQQPPYSATGTAIMTPHAENDSIRSQNGPMPHQGAVHHGYSSTAPGAASFHQQHQQYTPHGMPAPYQGHSPHYHHPSGYPSTSPTFSDHQEYNPQLNPFEVKHRRRTTRSQFKLLETTFRENPKPNAAVRKDISEQLDMPIRAVQIWFQNRRAKAKAVAKRGHSSGGAGSVQSADGSVHGSDADNSRSNLSMDARSVSFDSKEDAMYPSAPHHHNQHHYHHHHHSRSYSGSNHEINGLANLSSSSSGSGYNSLPPPSSHQSVSNSFKMPFRPSRLDIDPPTRRLTTNSMPTSAASSSSSFVSHHSPTFASHATHSTPSSASYDEAAFSHRPVTSSSAPYDDRYRSRGPLTSPSVLSREASSSMQFDRSGPYSQTSANMSVNYDGEGRSVSLPGDTPYPQIPSTHPSLDQEYHQSSHRPQYTEQNYSQHHQSSNPQANAQGEYWKY